MSQLLLLLLLVLPVLELDSGSSELVTEVHLPSCLLFELISHLNVEPRLNLWMLERIENKSKAHMITYYLEPIRGQARDFLKIAAD